MVSLSNQIKAVFEAESRKPTLVPNGEAVPASYELIDPQWLSSIVCKPVPGAKIISFECAVPDALDRGHMRLLLRYNEVGTAANLPASVFCKDAQKLHMRLYYSEFGIMESEVAFYNDIRSRLKMETPASFFAAHDTRAFNYIIVFEDLVAQGCEFCTQATSITRERAESQLSHLAQLHGQFYGKTQSVPWVAGLSTFAETYRKIERTLNMYEKTNHGFRAAQGVIPPRLFARQADVWLASQKAIELHTKRPAALTHNDTHLRNWYINSRGGLRLADWQIYARSDWAHDVAFTLSTSLSVENRRTWERDLLRYYLEKLHEAGAPLLSFDDAWQSYRGHLFTALNFWTPALKADFDYHPEPETLEMIRRISTAIDDLDALNSFD